MGWLRVRGQLEPSCTAGGDIKWYSGHGARYEGPSQTKHRITIESNNFTSGYLSTRIKTGSSRRYFIPVFITHYQNSQKVGGTQVSVDG